MQRLQRFWELEGKGTGGSPTESLLYRFLTLGAVVAGMAAIVLRLYQFALMRSRVAQ